MNQDPGRIVSKRPLEPDLAEQTEGPGTDPAQRAEGDEGYSFFLALKISSWCNFFLSSQNFLNLAPKFEI